MDRRRETEYGKASTSCKQFDDGDEKLTLAVNVDKGTRKLYDQMGTQETEQPESRNKWQESHSESRMNIRKEDATLVQSSIQGRKEQYQQSSEKITGQNNLRRKAENFSRISETHDTNRIKTSIIQSEARSKNQEENSRETRERNNQKDEGAVQTKSRKEAQKPTGLRSSHEYSLEENSSSRASLDLVSQTRIQQFDVEEGLEEVERNSQVILIPPSSQLVARGSLHVDPTSGVAINEVSGKSSESGPSALYTNSEGKTSSFCDESYVIGRQEETYEEPLNFTTHEDALGSVHRLEESSMQFVGEFVEKARHEVSTSEIQTDKNTAVSKVVSEADKQWKKNSGQYGSEDFQLKGREPRQSSEGSGAKGPSDEMWDVTEPICSTSSMKRVPSNESVSSGTWFSGRESDKNSDENVKRERSSMPQEAAPSYQLQLRENFYSNSRETSDAMGSKNKERHREAKGDGNTVQGIPSGVEVEPSLSRLSAKSTRRSPIVEEISETGKIDETRSSSMVQLAQPFSARLTEVSGSPGKGGELKQRKLQRNKQALLEAKKAADTWEVPVGAVLVQHGKIIARGCNLVEELRDSTAHAEMICIREASNVLRTWRLAQVLQARISTLVWGAPNKLLGADGSWVRLFPNGGDGSEPSDKPAAPVHPFHPKMTIRRGVLASDCAEVMQQFFQLRRRKKEKNPETLPPPSSLPIASQPTKFLTKMQHMFNLMFCL
ncbi:hypothetical protein Patl1_16554 [Pistacia atlantica]|uniref:Uncharacterized protein n=1 Tax=Pistacia atlantica TaxID=434234 RepID=A0ACC1B8T0_9ROSI|nr:hypothetical protein Patl1_16554 [Pistacia atlantica]